MIFPNGGLDLQFGVTYFLLFSSPDRDDTDAWYKFILENFERHYLNNRAPFGFYVHEWYITAYPAIKEALVKFMDLINNLNDVYMVSLSHN